MPDSPPRRQHAVHAPTPRAGRSTPAVVRFAVAVIVLLAADLVTKSIAFARVAPVPVVLPAAGADGSKAVVPPHGRRVVIPRVLALHLTVNEGAVFGFGRGGRWIFVAFSVIATVVIVTAFARGEPGAAGFHVVLAAVLAGALGNLYDRLRFGVVRDLLELFPGVRLPFGLQWPDGSTGLYPWIFNVADVCLVVGLLLLMVLMYRHDRREARGG